MPRRTPPHRDNAFRGLFILAFGCILTYAGLAAKGDLRGQVGLALAAHAALVVATLIAWRLAARIGRPATRWIVIAAIAFRLAAAWGGPMLSDDLYRYVWDGRVQVAGVHPYRYAPDDPALAGLRDPDWARINHPEVPTIYPPLAQAVFAVLAGSGLGPAGFQIAMALADVAVVFALLGLLRACRLPDDRLVLYAWNPLAVLEAAGSGHLEPLGVALVVVAVAWTARRRRVAGAMALGLAVHAKLLPVVLVPGFARRAGWAARAALVVALIVPVVPYAATGPAVGGGTFAYAERWERNASVYVAVHAAAERVDTAARLKPRIDRLRGSTDLPLPWDWMYRHVWPREIARGAVAGLALAWIAVLAIRRGLAPERLALWTIGGVLLLSPTVHPWYLLWFLPFAAATRSPAWLAWAALVPIAYLDRGGDVPAWARAIEYVPVAALLVVEIARGALRPADGARAGID